jgi:hypothetical protein
MGIRMSGYSGKLCKATQFVCILSTGTVLNEILNIQEGLPINDFFCKEIKQEGKSVSEHMK